jgi:hypothetical protein
MQRICLLRSHTVKIVSIFNPVNRGMILKADFGPDVKRLRTIYFISITFSLHPVPSFFFQNPISSFRDDTEEEHKQRGSAEYTEFRTTALTVTETGNNSLQRVCGPLGVRQHFTVKTGRETQGTVSQVRT